MAIKKLQNNHTTPEQSKRLLELGVPAWTADIMFDKNRRRYELIETEDESLAETQRTLFYNGGAIPHWSVGRLIEIYVIARGVDTSYLPIERGEDMVKYLVRLYEEKVKDLDFSRLEE